MYINGIQIERGKNKDYTIDYNLAEISFNTTYPITNDMRIAVEFQYADRNYTRFLTYEEAVYKSEKLNISGYFYSESDAKNQPLQQNLTDLQKNKLAAAGNNSALMIAESAFIDAYDENKILYKKVINGTINVFEYSQNENDELYFVTFTNVGLNSGNYKLDRSTAVGNIFVYVGENLGSYNPIIRLTPPTKQQTFISVSYTHLTLPTICSV